jgi:ABC-2 type transport system permease protein
MKQALSIARKELEAYFGSPMALIFVGVFLVVTLFTFFWATAFWSRGIADVRPLFQWMPLLMIFLIAALTMRQWSEEQQSGTLEMLLTMPVSKTQLVIGKFLAVLALVGVALLITISLPITVALLGRIDFGPVIGGYLATILMASAYAAIGLFISSRTDNQIVALILTVIVCGLFYLVGSPTITNLTTGTLAEALRALGTGSRFESIERGVIDLRDLIYYASITILFLVLNVISLDGKRWGSGTQLQSYRRNRMLTAVLLIINLIVFNTLLFRVNTVRADLTQDGDYTLSQVTRDLVGNLQEPLLIRGYFSQKTHPLLAPLIPRIRDLLEEYEIAGKGKVQIDFVDPITNPDLEAEANQTYGIRSTPLQMSDRGGQQLVNAYLSILIRYGDQNQVLSLLDMIDVNEVGGDVDIRLRNPEYDLTSSIQRVVYGFQSLDSVLARLESPARMTLYVTPATLPESLIAAPAQITAVADTIQQQSNGKFEFTTVDMAQPPSGTNANTLLEKYQIQPIAAGFFTTDTFYMHVVIESGSKYEVIYPTGSFSETETRNAIESALKRLAPGSLQAVGVWTTPDVPQVDMFGQQQPSLQSYQTIVTTLRKNYDVRTVDLSSGSVPADLNALVIVGSQNMTDLERYAIDQFLMRGGSVFVAEGTYQLGVDQQGGLALQPINGGLKDMLDYYGVKIDAKLVMDTQNAPFPIQVQRNVGGVTVQEIQQLNYPQFVDVRSDAMERGNPVVAGLPSVTLNWVSPLIVDTTKNAERTVTTLLKSTTNSWTTTDTATQPNLDLYPDTGFPEGTDKASYPLAVAITGSFTSYFSDKPSPFATPTTVPAETTPIPTATLVPSITPTATSTPSVSSQSFVTTSPDSARLIVVGSAEFLNDNIFALSQRLGDERSANNLQFVQNSVDWFVQDTALSSIRAKGASSRLLRPLVEGEQGRWEVFNYAFALLSLIGLGALWQIRRRTERPMDLLPPRAPADVLPPATTLTK